MGLPFERIDNLRDCRAIGAFEHLDQFCLLAPGARARSSAILAGAVIDHDGSGALIGWRVPNQFAIIDRDRQAPGRCGVGREHNAKGSEGGTVLVNKRLAAALRRYAAANPRHCVKPDAALIYSGKGGGFSAQTIVNLFATLYAAAGITGASSHSGRRQFVTSLADKGINPRVIQILVRHRNLNTTMVYIDAGEGKLRKAIEMVE